jgi:hypothetical protein
LTTGETVSAQAPIVFDTNAPLLTNTSTTTIDSGTPTSNVIALPARENANFTVKWGGSDEVGGSGIASYDVFVSENGGPYTLWLAATALTSARFAGQPGRTYRFFSQAADHVGHVEAAPGLADAQTETGTRIWHNVVQAFDVGGEGGVPDGVVVAGDALTIINYINAFGPGPVPENAPFGPPYLDTVDEFGNPTGDDFVTAGDALAIINYINSFAPGLPGPAGESPSSPFLAASSYEDASIADMLTLLAQDVAAQRRRRVS